MFVKQLCLGILLIFLGACGGTSTPDPTPDITDKTSPELTFSIPTANSSTVPINVKFAFTFSEAMDEGSLELTGTPSIALGTPAWTANSTGVAFENETLAASTPYTLTLTAKDTSGNALATTTLTFTTSDTADTTAPSNPTGLVATPADGQVTLTWGANPESDIAGYTLYVGTAENALEPTTFITETTKTITGLTNDTPYFFAISAVDVANNPSSKTTSVFATPSTTVTDTTPPKIQASDPADGATEMSPRDTSLEVRFSEPMDEASLEFTITPRFGANDALPNEPFNIIWSENDTVVTLQPSVSNLVAEDTTFTLSVSAKDKAGNALSGDKEISFKMGFDVPFLVSSTPADGATDVPGLSKGETITLTFSEAVATNTFQIDTNFPSGCYDIPQWETGSLTVNFISCFLYDENTYTFSYKGQDLDGHGFEGSISFSTVPDTSPPSIHAHSPLNNATGIPLQTNINIYFDDEMDEASTLAAVSSSSDLGCTWTLTVTKLACVSSNLQANTTYTIAVSTEAKDTSGNNLCLGQCRDELTRSFNFRFSTIVTSTVGELRVNISGAPDGLAKVKVTGPYSYSSGNLGSSRTLTNLTPGDYTITAEEFMTGLPNKPTCRIYTPTPSSQTETVTAGQSATASVSYSYDVENDEPCESLPDEP
jgi:methionine-rich copper-binding protein CopC